MPEISPRSLTGRLLSLLRQGLTPERLALSIALGMVLSCFPVFGTTTFLCTVVALAFRLNLPAIQAGNYLALPLQLALFVPFLRLGERLLHVAVTPLSPGQMVALAKSSPGGAARALLSGQWHAIVGWLLVAPGLALLLYLLLRPLMKLLIARASNRGLLTIRE